MPTPVVGAARRVRRPAQDAQVRNVEQFTAVAQRHDVVDRQVGRWMRRMLAVEAGALPTVTPDVGAQ